MPLSDYRQTAIDWRGQLRGNERKTRMVIVTFFLMYVFVGLFIDVFVLHSTHPQLNLGRCLHLLLTLQALPYATMLLVGVAMVSLLITYAAYDRLMLLGTNYHEITSDTARNLQERQLYNVVEEMKVAAGLSFLPKIYLIDANYMNAFASGYSEKSAMIAVTRGLFEKLNRAELQAVVAHELSHIRHHDIKLTLMVAILSNILLMVIDVLFYSIIYNRSRRQDNRLLMVIMMLRYVLPLVTILLAMFLSRTREYMADAGAVELMRDNDPMARALLKITDDHHQHAEQYHEEYGKTPHEQVRQASYLFDSSSFYEAKSFSSALSTHPSLKDRLKAIGFDIKKGGGR